MMPQRSIGSRDTAKGNRSIWTEINSTQSTYNYLYKYNSHFYGVLLVGYDENYRCNKSSYWFVKIKQTMTKSSHGSIIGDEYQA